MESERHYLERRANFHREMSRTSPCPEARCVHESFVRAYTRRLETLPDHAPPPRDREPADAATGPLLSLAAT